MDELFFEASVLKYNEPNLSSIFSFANILLQAYIVSEENVGAECFPLCIASNLKQLASPLQLIALARDIIYPP